MLLMHKIAATVNHVLAFTIEEHVSLQDKEQCQKSFGHTNMTPAKDSPTIKLEEENWKKREK